ncbi:MAG: DNA-processing protein DprA [bacterium]
MKPAFTIKDDPYILGINFALPLIRYERFLTLMAPYGYNLQKAWSDRLRWPVGSDLLKVAQEFNPSAYLKQLKDLKINYITVAHPNYPQTLKSIENPPLVIYYRGNYNLLFQKSLAVVGSRLMTAYGSAVVKELVPAFCRAGFCIVSGLALGVDAAAHRTALENGGATLAVMPCGLDMIIPRTNAYLFNKIAASSRGLVISEFPLQQRPRKYLFPLRSRVVAGLSYAVVVVEAGEKSGTAYTVAEGIKQGKRVFAVPGSISSLKSRGSNYMIAKKEALAALNAASVLKELGVVGDSRIYHSTDLIATLSGNERGVYQLLTASSLEFDDLLHQTRLGSALLNKVLTSLEIQGMVSCSEGAYAVC